MTKHPYLYKHFFSMGETGQECQLPGCRPWVCGTFTHYLTFLHLHFITSAGNYKEHPSDRAVENQAQPMANAITSIRCPRVLYMIPWTHEGRHIKMCSFYGWEDGMLLRVIIMSTLPVYQQSFSIICTSALSETNWKIKPKSTNGKWLKNLQKKVNG